MTRLTNDIRDMIVRSATYNLPVQDHHAEARKIIEKAIYAAAPKEVRVLLDDDTLRPALAHTQMYVMNGNKHVLSYLDGSGFRGICDDRAGGRYPAKIHMDTADANRGVFGLIYSALAADGVVQRCIEQRDMLENVKSRLKSAVYSVKTVKRLYDVLEPDLHHLIPKSESGAALVVSVRVADDLRKLGADLPTPTGDDAA
jgi:hypothetical protein